MRILFWAALAFIVFVGVSVVEAQGADCNNNGQDDATDISSGLSSDCNSNGIPDECDSAADPLADCNLNGILDSCEPISTSALLGGFSGVLAMSGDTLLVCDPFEPPEPGEVPDPAEPPAVRLVEVYQRQANVWVLSDTLTPLDEEPEDGFGASLAIHGDVAVVGAPLSDSTRGAAYVFVRTETGWMQAAKLTAQLPSATDEYGTSVAVHGSDIIIGAPQLVPEDPNNPDQVLPAGYAEIWSQTGTGWERVTHIHVGGAAPAEPAGGEETGSSVAMAEGGWAFVGAPGFASGSGRVHAFLELGGMWMLQGSLAASDSIQNLGFGQTMSANGSTLVVSARNSLGGPPGSGPVGAIYTFDRTGSSWDQVTKTMSPHPDPNGYGDSVSICEDQLIVGEPNVDSSRGLVHLYRRAGTGWDLRESTRPAGTLDGDRYGGLVSTNGDWIGVAAIGLPAVFM
ncbi:MAG: FG-GAP repeat protein, partial [Planctomycetes bacterium]|nr:FG-GAP repeat protein [Planctomycetota bacterium]